MATQSAAVAGGAVLDLGAEDRRRLGLDENEHLRVIHSGPRTLLLERSGAGGDTAIPWDRDLILSANVRAFPLADVLRMLHGSGKSGYLSFADGEVEKAVYLHCGEVVFASSNQSIDRLGDCLLRAGIIGLEQLRETERRWAPPTRFGKALVERGLLSPRELWNGVKLQVEEIVRSLFSHTSGTVHFWEGAVQPDNVVRLSLPTRRLVDEGLERRDELLKVLASLQDPMVRIERCAGAPDRNGSASERFLLESLSGAQTFQGLCRSSGLDPLSCARAVRMLELVGAVVVNRIGAPESGAAAADESAIRNRVLDFLKLMAELIAPLVAVEGTQAVGQRLTRVIEDSSERHPELLRQLSIGAGGLPGPEELVARALRLPRDRERAVGSALGELVAYLEFELMNSPHIEEPDRFLEAVQDLRIGLEL